MTTTPSTERSIFANPDPAWLPAAELPVPRDHQERPLIVPPGGVEPVPYERVSRVSSAVDTLQWLMDWKLGLTALGMARSRDLCQMAAGLEWNDPRMQSIVATAHDRAGGNEKANWGTAVHTFTERGTPLEDIPPEMRYDVAAYRLGLEREGIEVVETEVFVVNDELRVAGTLDTIAVHESLGRYVEDKKTGKYAAMAVAVQLACYAHAKRVDMDLVAAGRWSPRGDLDVNLEVGVCARIPREGGSVTFPKVDIARGWRLAQLAMEVKEHQDYAGWSFPEPLGKVTRSDTIMASIEAAQSRPELRDIIAHCERYFTKAHKEAVNRRWKEVGSA